MNKGMEYLNKVQELLAQVAIEEKEVIEQAGLLVADALEKGGYLVLFGTGHSHLLAAELFYRAGGLVRVKPIFEESLMLHQGAAKSTAVERLSGYADILLKEYEVTKKDVVILISNSGRNALPIELAEGARKLGAKTIALTSLTHSRQSSARLPGAKRLFELADLVIDNLGCLGDAAVSIGEITAGPTSTVVGAAILNSVVCNAIEALQNRNQMPEVFLSSNVDGGEEANNRYLKTYKNRIPSL